MASRFTHLDSGKIETTESFFSNQFLQARINSGNASNEGYDPILEEGRDERWMEAHWKDVKVNSLKYDEDVNQYITLTLTDMVNPKSLAAHNERIVDLQADAGRKAVDCGQSAKKYLVYRTNADFLLLLLGLFHPNTGILGTAYFDKGGAYYFSAATSLKEMRGGRSGLSDVLEKLSNGFGKYVEILRTLKQSADNYLSFHHRFSPAEMATLEQTLTREARKRERSG